MRRIIIFFIALLYTNITHSQTDIYWTPISIKELKGFDQSMLARINIHLFFKLDFQNFKKTIQNVPFAKDAKLGKPGLIIQLPDPEGKLIDFEIYDDTAPEDRSKRSNEQHLEGHATNKKDIVFSGRITYSSTFRDGPIFESILTDSKHNELYWIRVMSEKDSIYGI